MIISNKSVHRERKKEHFKEQNFKNMKKVWRTKTNKQKKKKRSYFSIPQFKSRSRYVYKPAVWKTATSQFRKCRYGGKWAGSLFKKHKMRHLKMTSLVLSTCCFKNCCEVKNLTGSLPSPSSALQTAKDDITAADVLCILLLLLSFWPVAHGSVLVTWLRFSFQWYTDAAARGFPECTECDCCNKLEKRLLRLAVRV